MRNEGFVVTLRVVGGIVIVLGLIAAAYFLEMSSKSMFGSRTQISPEAVFGAALVFFYHFVLALILFGVGQTLEEASRSSHAQMLAASRGGAQQTRPKTTTCPNCMYIYTGDLRGQFCEACGEQL